MNLYLYGPPGAGKSTLGRALADELELPFLDLDEVIIRVVGMSIPDIFAQEGEAGFRRREIQVLEEVAGGEGAKVVALGGGALLDPRARRLAEESGQVLCLTASLEGLLDRLSEGSGGRPLLAGRPRDRLQNLLAARGDHYRSFEKQLAVDGLSNSALVWQAQQQLGAFRVKGMGQAYDVRVERGGLARLGMHLAARGLRGPVAVVSDRHVARFHLAAVKIALEGSGYLVQSLVIEPGEEKKTIETILAMWNFFVQAGIERGSTVVALGGGVVGDMTGFAAATFLRGVAWVNLPTSLLAMVDSSLGGKTGIDLLQAKNLVGAFYPPQLVLADTTVLETLPERELRGGFAEVVKHGVIADPGLFGLCMKGWEVANGALEQVVRQGIAVKLQVIDIDPYEKGPRQALNLGHTVGHGLEIASGFQLSHGEAVAIGMVSEAHLAQALGLAEARVAEKIECALTHLGLPTAVPASLDIERVIEAMLLDKKRAAGRIHFALPVKIGRVQTGVVIDQWQQMLLDQMTPGDSPKKS